MASIVVNRGLQQIGRKASAVTGTFNNIQVMSVDDSSNAFAAGDTALNTGGAVTNEFDAAFDSTPTASSQTVTHIMTIPTGSGNFTVRRIALHNDTATNVTTSSTTLISGVDGQTLAKTSDFSLAITYKLTYTSV